METNKISTFPYTTLFRSRRSGQASEIAGIDARAMLIRPSPKQVRSSLIANKRAGSDASVIWPQPLTAGAEDRKSTRLNSSHTVMSYAVFCLKKKTHVRSD